MAGDPTGTSAWIKFFTEAGIPAGTAVTYALTFSDNRIKTDMLLDLNKEYLRDMGITLMGDVIAILKHAKHVHEQTARDKILSASSCSASASSKRSTPATRMLEHYMRKDEDSPPTPRPKISESLAQRLGPMSERKSDTTQRKRNLEVNEAPPAKKVRRVLPEHEGGYKITMPSGSTPRTQKILAKQGIHSAKKTVFDRLGDGRVTSTTELEVPRITITGLGTHIVKSGSPGEKQSSVFSRLGDRSARVSSTSRSAGVSSTCDDDLVEDEDYDEDLDGSLQYAGVLKQTLKKNIISRKRFTGRGVFRATKFASKKAETTGTLRADSIEVKKPATVRGRLGAHVIQNRVPTEGRPKKIIYKKSSGKSLIQTAGILANPTNALKLSVKQRLGSGNKSLSEESSSNTMNTSVPARTKIKKVIKVKKIASKKTVPPAPKSLTFGKAVKEIGIKDRLQSNYSEMSYSNFSDTASFSNFSGTGSITMKSGIFSRLGT